MLSGYPLIPDVTAAFDPVRTSVVAVLQPPAAASLIASSEFASGSTFRRQVASCATAGQGGNRNDEGARKEAPENRASSRPGWRKLSLRYMVIHGHLFPSDIHKKMQGGGSLVVGREGGTSKPRQQTVQAAALRRAKLAACSVTKPRMFVGGSPVSFR